MKSSVVKLFAIVSLFAAVASQAGQFPFSFQVSSGSLPMYSPAPSEGEVAVASEAFMAKYGVEEGVLGTTSQKNGQLLVVLMSNPRSASNVWRKMLSVGDAFQGAGGIAYFRYDDGKSSSNPMAGYHFAGRIQVSEGAQATLLMLNGTPAVKGFVVAMDEKCLFANAKVTTAYAMNLKPTRLIKSFRNGYTLGYEHLVHGGEGAVLRAIHVTLGSSHPLGLITDICPVDVFVRY